MAGDSFKKYDAEADINNPTEDDFGVKKLRAFLKRADSLIDQVHNLYGMYVAGVEEQPPRERRTELDTLIQTLAQMPKPTVALRFKHEGIRQKYITYRDKWDKTMREVEQGIIQIRRQRKKQYIE